MFVWALHYFLSVMNGGKLVTQANKTQVVKHLIRGGVPYDGAANEEYWGIVKHDRSKKEAYNIVKDLYN